MKQFEVSKKHFKELFPGASDRARWHNYILFTVYDQRIEIDYPNTLIAKILTVLMFPILIIYHGLGSIREVSKEIRDIINNRNILKDAITHDTSKYKEFLRDKKYIK